MNFYCQFQVFKSLILMALIITMISCGTSAQPFHRGQHLHRPRSRPHGPLIRRPQRCPRGCISGRRFRSICRRRPGCGLRRCRWGMRCVALNPPKVNPGASRPSPSPSMSVSPSLTPTPLPSSSVSTLSSLSLPQCLKSQILKSFRVTREQCESKGGFKSLEFSSDVNNPCDLAQFSLFFSVSPFEFVPLNQHCGSGSKFNFRSTLAMCRFCANDIMAAQSLIVGVQTGTSLCDPSKILSALSDGIYMWRSQGQLCSDPSCRANEAFRDELHNAFPNEIFNVLCNMS